MQDIIIPSEEEHLELFPLDFEEFLWALDDSVTIPLIKKCFDTCKPLGEALHRKVMNDFRQYLLVGGMPQSVLAYIDGKTLQRQMPPSDGFCNCIEMTYRTKLRHCYTKMLYGRYRSPCDADFYGSSIY